jgi:N-acetylglutamate synthase-like GNAT family acetyltransferase
MVNLTFRPFLKTDLSFFKELAETSNKWSKNELNGIGLEDYLQQYEELAGEWRIWLEENNAVGLSYHLDCAPSNQKPWLGTILVKASERRRGIASSILDSLSGEFNHKGHKAIFAGVPIDEYEWSNFLSDCRFEQLKTEENKGETFLIMVRPFN